MYQVSVPVILEKLWRSDREDLLRKLRMLDCRRVFLSIGYYKTDREAYRSMLELLKKETAFFHREGFEVGAWLWTFLTPGNHDFDHMILTEGYQDPNMNCPLDERFRAFAGEYVSGIAGTGVDIILYDDDFRMGWIGDKSIGCFCPHHLKEIKRILGKDLPEDFEKRVLSGGPNEYRSAWLKAKGDSLKLFAREMRAAVDRVDPNVRLGICACMSVWDYDGVSAPELARILAGSTKPFLRLIGAPYWVGHFGGSRLQDVFEYERLERTWCGEGIEIVAEGDTYPRPRYVCPANRLEAFDTVMRSSGGLDGILKYAIDYCSSSAYEPMYAEKHFLNRDTYQKIDEVFGSKKTAGVRIFEPMNQFEASEIPEKTGGKTAQMLFFRTSAKLFSTLSIPTTYEGEGTAVAAFGEAARTLPPEMMDHGVILDAKGAEILSGRGIDVGLVSVDSELSMKQTLVPSELMPSEEYYPSKKEFALITNGAGIALKIRESAVVDSYYLGKNGGAPAYLRTDDCEAELMKNAVPAAYRYENAAGQRFFVLCFNAEHARQEIWRQYAKSREIAEAVEWLSGKKLPAYLYGAPDAYLLVKQDQTRLAVGIWNLCDDDIPSPVIELSESYCRAQFFRTGGQLKGNRVFLDRIEPYGFCFFELEK
ncbi:MAG: hypothetical protein IK088_08335 [Lachnospiraceae bacterium]|nr:hypothetical protein [Lachnospiraceae bacterium]